MNYNLFLFLGLVAAHVISDFPLNPNWLALGKRRERGFKRLGYLLCHCLIVALLSYIFILGWRSRACLFIAAAVGACHLAVDYARLWAEAVIYRGPAPTIPKGAVLSGRAEGDWWRRNRLKWWIINIGDQTAHLLCIAGIVWLPLFRPWLELA